MLSWKPKRRGKTYCSPACGCGCTHAAFQAAHANAKKLAKRMGRGYKPYVWENFGWHFKVFNGKIEVYPATHTHGFIVFVQTSPQFIARGKNPKLLVNQAVEELRKHVAEMNDNLAKLLNDLSK